ncbi:MAG: PSD1 domain-containing protein [Planctomycetia bacterium]|nr:PSD1 domain-containing protein [Planctomycetia bacterium]
MCGSMLQAADAPVDFNRQIRPLLSDRCFRCHGPDGAQRKADLRLDSADGATAQRDGGAAIVPKDPAGSELIRRITSTDESEQMPPAEAGKPLSPEEIELLRRWIEQGAAFQTHWSLIPPRRSPLPRVGNSAWPVNEVDRWIMAKLEQAGLAPAPEADPVTLLRRLSLDLTGLLPTPAEVDAFTGERDPLAYERAVDRFLASPEFGEKLAMYWLDLVRYADTVGYHGDQEHPISPYRDWVIQAFNENLPFDRFTMLQLAGDLLPEPTVEQKIATGYNRLLQTSHEGGVQQKEYQIKYDADRVRNLSSVWLGATLGCAQCHDHKFDPYKQKDFYSLAAFFADVDDTRTFKGGDTNPTKREPELVVPAPLDKLERRTMITETIAPRAIRVLNRGDWMDESGEIVAPAVPHFLKQIDAEGRRATRLDLAKWLVSADNPLVARVFVNRLWFLFFGAGLSNSLEDFGAQGEAPSHPELLDWLAVEFVQSEWNVKHIIKLLVLSSAYRQSSQATAELLQRDPQNRLFARQASYRLPGELIRDNFLAVSGLLARRMGGAGAHPYQPAGYYKHLNFPRRDYKADTDANQFRRGVYTHWQRQYLHPMLKAFDAPSREECTVRRPISNTPLAALALLNDPSSIEAARAFAARILREAGATPEDRAGWAFCELLSRRPEGGEIARIVQLHAVNASEYRADPEAARKLLGVGLSPVPADLDPAELAAWTQTARALFNLHEAITRN